MSRNKNIILVTLVLIITGALLTREFPRAGFIFTLVVLGVYIVLNIPRAVKNFAKFRSANIFQRIKSVLTICMAVLFVTALLGGGLHYFMLLSVLAVDYLIVDKNNSR